MLIAILLLIAGLLYISTGGILTARAHKLPASSNLICWLFAYHKCHVDSQILANIILWNVTTTALLESPPQHVGWFTIHPSTSPSPSPSLYLSFVVFTTNEVVHDRKHKRLAITMKFTVMHIKSTFSQSRYWYYWRFRENIDTSMFLVLYDMVHLSGNCSLYSEACNHSELWKSHRTAQIFKITV